MTAPDSFPNEAAFEDALIANLTSKYRWSPEVLNHPTEAQLIANWARIIFENNNTPDRLNGVPLSEAEIHQLVEQITLLKSPADVQKWLQGKQMLLKRNHPELNEFANGRTIPLDIFDPRQVGGGDSTYQIARQPRFDKKSDVSRNRRGDFLLLINGIPLIHVELKNSGHDVTEAAWQIQRYHRESAFTGFLSTVQMFVAMTPNDMLYFANPGRWDKFYQDFWFTWTDEHNQPYDDWQGITENFLGIPPAHKMVGDYMVADDGDGILKVMRPYQVHAVEKILGRLREINAARPGRVWAKSDQRGGYIWHTTGSGKTMTSFTAAKLAARYKLADSVVFVVDRIELGNQSELEYINFAGDQVDVHAPGNAQSVLADIKDPRKRLIITSIHKLDKLTAKDGKAGKVDVGSVQDQRIVFIVDEAHRTTFGEMFARAKESFPHAVFFGFTGTPIQVENQKKGSNTATLFGNELHRYAIYYGLHDGNVLGFDTQAVHIYPADEMRRSVALDQAGADTEAEALADDAKAAIYREFTNPREVPWVTYFDEDTEKWVKGIEDYVPKENWQTDEYRASVVDHVHSSWQQRTSAGVMHGLFAASSIPEALEYYRLFKQVGNLKVTVVVSDANENKEGAAQLDAALEEVLTDYNARYKKHFAMEDFDAFRKDAADRLAHKGKAYRDIDGRPEMQLDMIIVVDQLLTGYDSKYIGVLYLDKVLRGANLVQAFSRTNRVFGGKVKPFGSVVYFRKPMTMRENIVAAFDLYSGHGELGVFVETLPEALAAVNDYFDQVKGVFADAGIDNFEKLPHEKAARAKFAATFVALDEKIQAALIQGFSWNQSVYEFTADDGVTTRVIVEIDYPTYQVLLQRYSELSTERSSGGDDHLAGIPLDLDILASAQTSQLIDYAYLDERFALWRKAVGEDKETQESLLEQLQRQWAQLSTDDQEIARRIVEDVLAGVIDPHDTSVTFRGYLSRYKAAAKDSHIHSLTRVTGLVEKLIADTLDLSDGTTRSYKDHGRGKALQDGVDDEVFASWLNSVAGQEIPPWEVDDYRDNLIEDFFTQGGFDVDEWTPR